MPPTIDFPNIRPHQDSRDRAFEELCFQLLPELEKLPPGATVVRNGTPDGGVEFRAVLPNGDQWAWQAKYLFELGGSEFGQLDRSIRTALISQPRLTRYTFCLPYNRPDSSAPHQKSAMQRWNEHCRKWAGWASARGMSLEIGYVGESELLAALTQPGEAGRARYWFDTMILTPAWIRDRLKEALATAGPRYTPELSIDLPIASVFDGLGRSGELQRRIRAALGAVHRSLGWFSVRDGPPLDDQIKALKVTCDDELERLRTAAMGIDVTGTGWQDFEGLGAACAAARNACEEIWEAVRDRRERLTHPASSGSGRPREFERERYAWDSAAWHVRQTVNAVDELSQLAASDAARLVNLPCLLVTGRPGAGKTHLLCDVAKRRCDAGQATLVLHGEAFTRDEPWSQIRNRLHVACELDEFLGALDAAAEANGGRSLIFLDALNDGDGQVLWPKYLAGFIEKLRHWPRLGLAVSCRTSYVEAVLPPGLDAAAELVQVEHRGFAGFEYKAAKSFFDHYGLQLPDFPLLVPEFQNPLFLKLMCRGLQSRGFVTMPRGTFGVSAIFEGYLSAANDRLSDPERCDYRREDRLVERAMEAIAEEMLSTGQDWMDWARLTRIVDALLPGREYSRSLSRGLLNEGLLVADRGRRFGNAEAVLFSYQRLGDHQLASEFCQRAGSKDALIAECRRITSDESTAWRHSGLLEALAVQLPERFDVEIYEVVTRPDSSVVRRAFLESLVWRDTAAFPSDVSGYLQATAESLGHEPVLESVLQVACIPEHPYNAGWLHGILWGVPMAQRDAWWSIFVHNYGSDEAVVARIIDWAWSDGPLRASAESALLCATALAWFLTTPNRYMRDRATKGIVNLLKAKPETLAALLQRFHGVNDPYVAERLYAAAYAICLTSSDRETVRTVAEAVYVRVFEDCRPPVHVLLRDYARGTIERAASLGCVLQGVDLASVRPPYYSPWPIRAATKEDLEQRYPSDAGYASLRFSVLSMWGDFGRYVVEPATRDFRAPNEKRRLAAARKAAAHRFEQRWAELLASLGDGAEEFVNAVGILDDPLASLSEGQRTLWDAAMREYGDTKCIRGPLPFDQELACRWVFSRTLSLGWTPGKFGAFDRLIDRDASRTGHKVERIGKKYEWIALHELLARIADHCALTPRWSDAPHKPYDGPWQLSIRDIDPSLPGAVKAWRRASDRACWWSPIAMTIPDGADSREAQAWVEDPAKLPDAPSLLCVDDLQGVRWLTLQGYYHWRGETPPELHHLEAESCWLWYQVRGYLLQASDVERFVDWAKGQNWMGRWMPESITVHEAFLGEYPWHPSWAQATSGWSTPGDRNGPVPLLVPVVEYSSEGNGYDCSVDETVNAMLPAPNLISGMGLRWSGSDLTYERAGRPVIQDPSGRGDGPGVLLAARDPLSEFLAKEGLALAWTILGEKLRSIKGPSRFTRRQIHGAAVFDAGTLRQISVSSEYLDR